MITALPHTAEHEARTAALSSVAALTTEQTALAVPQTPDHPWLPYAIGALLGLLVVLALAGWALVVLSDGDYSGVVDLWKVILP